MGRKHYELHVGKTRYSDHSCPHMQLEARGATKLGPWANEDAQGI